MKTTNLELLTSYLIQFTRPNEWIQLSELRERIERCWRSLPVACRDHPEHPLVRLYEHMSWYDRVNATLFQGMLEKQLQVRRVPKMKAKRNEVRVEPLFWEANTMFIPIVDFGVTK